MWIMRIAAARSPSQGVPVVGFWRVSTLGAVDAASTIAMTHARTAAGRLAHASTTRARAGSVGGSVLHAECADDASEFAMAGTSTAPSAGCASDWIPVDLPPTGGAGGGAMCESDVFWLGFWGLPPLS
jgi:hypothetical protein